MALRIRSVKGTALRWSPVLDRPAPTAPAIAWPAKFLPIDSPPKRRSLGTVRTPGRSVGRLGAKWVPAPPVHRQSPRGRDHERKREREWRAHPIADLELHGEDAIGSGRQSRRHTRELRLCCPGLLALLRGECAALSHGSQTKWRGRRDGPVRADRMACAESQLPPRSARRPPSGCPSLRSS